MNITYNNLLSVNDYCRLRKSVEFHDIPERFVKRALERSDFIIAAYINNIAVGMARLMTDGTQAYIMDVVVHPDFQGNGIGRGLMEHIIEYIDNLEFNQMVVNLLTNDSKIKFYEKFGFFKTQGMHKWMDHVN